MTLPLAMAAAPETGLDLISGLVLLLMVILGGGLFLLSLGGIFWYVGRPSRDPGFSTVVDAGRWGGFQVFQLLVLQLFLQILVAQLVFTFTPVLMEWSFERGSPAAGALYEFGVKSGWLPPHGLSSLVQTALIHGISSLATLAVVLAIVRGSGRSPVVSLGIWRPPSPRIALELLLVLIAFLPACLLIKVLWSALLAGVGLEPRNQETVEAFIDSLEAGHGLDALALGVGAILVAPVIEEVLYRGLLHTYLARRLRSPWLPAILSSSLFALIHFNLAALLPIWILGILLARVYERRGSLLDAILVHAYFNAISLLSLYAMLRLAPHLVRG